MFLFTDAIISVEVIATSTPTINQLLTLQCIAITVMGITSTVDIIWATGDRQVRRVNNVKPSSNINSTSVYNDSFTIPLLNISDIGSVYQCELLITSVIPITAKTNYTISLPGTYIIHFFEICVLHNILYDMYISKWQMGCFD